MRTEKFAGLTRAGAIRREIVWNARWRVAAEELPTFFGQTGTFPGDWPEPDCLITSVMPKRLSEMEYEVTVEAQHRSNPDLLQYYSIEDRSDLANRTDIAVDMADFHLTAAMAGYQKLPDGHYMPIPNWNALAGCPFRSESKLPANMIDLTLRCLVVTVSIYVSGGVKSRIAELAAWTQGRVTNAAVEGIEGSFLRIRQTCKETFDDSGKLYTRITRSYQKAPGDYIWSTNYWETH